MEASKRSVTPSATPAFTAIEKEMSLAYEKILALDSPYTRWQAEMLLRFVDVNDAALEIGAGSGRIAARVYGRTQRLTISEGDPALVARIEENRAQQFPLALVEIGNPLDREFVAKHKGEFDTVYSVHVLEHIEDDRTAFSHMLSMLRPGGRLITQVPALPFVFSKWDRQIGHYRRYTRRTLGQLAKEQPTCQIVQLDYHNFPGILGWLVNYRLLGRTLHNDDQKRNTEHLNELFNRFLLPATRLIEGVVAPPIGLGLQMVVRLS